MYLTPDSIVQSSIDTGFRTVLTGAVNDFSQSAALVGEWYQKYNGYHPLISFELGFHAEYTTSRNILEDLQRWRTCIKHRCTRTIPRLPEKSLRAWKSTA